MPQQGHIGVSCLHLPLGMRKQQPNVLCLWSMSAVSVCRFVHGYVQATMWRLGLLLTSCPILVLQHAVLPSMPVPFGLSDLQAHDLHLWHTSLPNPSGSDMIVADLKSTLCSLPCRALGCI